jgi:hypothetical protein
MIMMIVLMMMIMMIMLKFLYNERSTNFDVHIVYVYINVSTKHVI